jgi:hypothetical protein
MGIFEVISPCSSTNINDQIDMDTVNPCIVHNVKPNFFLKMPLRKKKDQWGMKVVECKEDSCMRCCGDQEDIVAVWNKWNPRK